MLARRRVVMTAWAAFLADKSEAKVVPFKGKRR